MEVIIIVLVDVGGGVFFVPGKTKIMRGNCCWGEGNHKNL